MAAALSQSDFQRLVEIISHHPDFATETGRLRLLRGALRGVPRGESVLAGLDLSGPPRGAAVEVVTRLLAFGRLGNRHALTLVLESVRDGSGDDLRTELDGFIADLDGHPRASRSAGRTSTILHLSDLHFGTLADAGNWHSQLAEDVKRELGCERLDGLICSGDLTQRATGAEYAAAVELIARLSREFGLTPERIVLVPGNHDLNWDLSKAAYDPCDPIAFKAADETERQRWIVDGPDLWVRDATRYLRRFAPFSERLYEKVKGTPYPTDYPDQFDLHHWPDLGMLVLGLNSAWAIDHHHRDRSDIHPEAITNALDTLRAHPDWDACLKVAVWHHPLTSPEPSRLTDHGFLERLAQAGFRLALHGHIHRAETAQYRYDLTPGGRRLDILAAGTFGAPSHEWVPGYPLQYNLLRLNGQLLTVETRRRAEVNGVWKPDACWPQGPGRDPLPRYHIDL